MAEALYVPRFLPASFKGFAFDAMSADSEHGRRGFSAEYPFGEDTNDVDMGRKIRKYSIKARFVTNDHVAQSNAFIAVIESPGAGTLIHPTRGAVRARCESAKVADEILEGYGQTTVDLAFVEANDAALGVGVANVFGTPIVAFVGSVAAQFAANYRPAAAPFYERATILGSAAAGFTALSRALTGSLGLAPDANAWGQVSALNRMAAAPENSYDPATTTAALQAGFAAIDRYAASADAKYAAFRSVANASAQVSALASPAGSASQNAVFAATRLLSAAYMARAAGQMIPATMADAFGWLDDVTGILDQEAAAAQLACDHDAYLAITAFRASSAAAITYTAFNAPVRVVYSFRGPISSQVAAYRIYGDAKLFGDVEAANPNMPCFAMGPDLIATKAAA